MRESKTSIGIIGGGLAGLTSAILLNRNGFNVTLIEKRQFPFHRVCGEYISNEVLPFLQSLDLNLDQFSPSRIANLAVSSVSGKSLEVSLQQGGFGLSRYVLDNYLYEQAKKSGVEFITAKVNTVSFADEEFNVGLSTGISLNFRLVLAAYGKRSNLDQKLGRKFFYRRSPYMGVKYHIKTDLPADLIRLDSFKGGYCGTCKIEDDLYNLCYLTDTKNLKNHGSITEMEQMVLFQNPQIKQIFTHSDFVSAKPEVINEISFERKSLVENHILFCGDAAGMITPLCGNGMAMAIHSGKLLADCIIDSGDCISSHQRLLLEERYGKTWTSLFASRLRSGRLIQNLFLDFNLSNMAILALRNSRWLTGRMVNSTHGKPF